MRALIFIFCLVAVAKSSHAVPRSPELEKLAQARVDAARKPLPVLRVMYNKGQLPLSALLHAIREVAFAARDSALQGESLLKPLAEYRDTMKTTLEMVQKRYESGMVNASDVDLARYALAEAEYWLAEAKEKK
jgi:hypothetical protein